MRTRFPAILAALLLSAIPSFAESAAVSATATYYDGSLWMGICDGIVRVGRNGRTILYSAGELGFSGVSDLVSDESGNMWILGSDGLVRNYSFVSGFALPDGLPSGVQAIAFDRHSGSVFAATEAALFRWNPTDLSISPEQIAKLESPVRSIVFSPGGTIWLLGENTLFRLDEGASPVLVSNRFHINNVSNSIALEIETNGARIPWVMIFLFLILGAALGFLLPRSLRAPDRKQSVGPSAQSSPELPVKVRKPASPKIESPSPEPEIHKPVPTAKDDIPGDEFVARVRSIIEDNIATPKFGVDDIAEVTGLSRIHLNRKLKAAGLESPSVLLKKARMELAAKLILEGAIPMQEIALRCGFSSASYFATAFHDFYGVAPTDYNSAAIPSRTPSKG